MQHVLVVDEKAAWVGCGHSRLAATDPLRPLANDSNRPSFHYFIARNHSVIGLGFQIIQLFLQLDEPSVHLNTLMDRAT